MPGSRLPGWTARLPSASPAGLFPAELDEAAAVGRVDVRVVDIRKPAIGLELQAGVNALPPCLADVGEKGPSLRHAVDERDVVVEGAAEQRHVVAEIGTFERFEDPADAGLLGMRHHLLKIRIADEEIRQAAGVLRAGAGQFGRRRRAVRNGIAGIGGQPGREPIGHAAGGVEVIVAVVAAQVAAVLVT